MFALQGDRASCCKQEHWQAQHCQAAAGLCVTMLLLRCRFDRELVFPLPSVAARTSILGIHTVKWREPPSKELRQDLANLCVGYCGADLKARLDTAQDALLGTQAWGLARAPPTPHLASPDAWGANSASRLTRCSRVHRSALSSGGQLLPPGPPMPAPPSPEQQCSLIKFPIK